VWRDGPPERAVGGLAPWKFEFHFPGSLTSTFLDGPPYSLSSGRFQLVVVIVESLPHVREFRGFSVWLSVQEVAGELPTAMKGENLY